MSKVISGISMSLDGFVTGPNVTREQQLGDGGQVLHRWLHEPDPRDAELMAEMGEDVGAILMGRLSYNLAEGDGGWGDGGPAGRAPCFVLTHNPPAPETVRARRRSSLSSPTASTARSSRRRQRRGTRWSAYTAPALHSSASPPAYWTTSKSIWPRSCSAAAPGCSITWAASSCSSAPR